MQLLIIFNVILGLSIELNAFGFDSLQSLAYCNWAECCDERSIPGNIDALQKSLEGSLFGQHIVLQHLVPALRAHFSKDNTSRKPLVMSFHGTPGTGKNFVADKIAEALYLNGLKSRYVHKYMGRIDFSLESEVDKYKARINKDVRNGIASCPRSMFIFDEVDKMPRGVFESLTSMLDYNSLPDGQDHTKAIFIFLSNTAGVQISDRLGKLIKSGTLRDETKLSHFEQMLERVAYNLEGGFKKTGLIEAHVIDHYLPFLPLEKSHVMSCLQVEFKHWEVSADRETLDSLIKEVISYDPNYNLFATSGCKRLEKRVGIEVKKLRIEL